jgi:glycosyltransferase involved in cell wall biosynthesis
MVSVIIPTYNRFDLLLKSIDSIINQTYKNFEIIIVDDCSDDKRYETLLDNKNVRYFRLKERSGLPAVTRNFGIKQSVGDWIAFLDDDDVWLPDKLKLQVNYTDSYKFLCTESYYEGQ